MPDIYRFRVTMRPLEPYTFGTDQNIAFPGQSIRGRKASHYVGTSFYPEQTSILGLIRYLVLKSKDLLRADFRYRAEEREKMNKLVGEKSFSFGESWNGNGSRFGVIQRISPLFALIEESGKEHALVRNPFFHLKQKDEETDKASFDTLKIDMERKIKTNWGDIALPANYSAKEGLCSGFLDLNATKDQEDRVIFNSFKEKSVVSVNKNGYGESDKKRKQDGFFRRQTIVPEDPTFRFAVYVDLSEKALPEKCVAYMGKKKSAFLIESSLESVAEETNATTAFADTIRNLFRKFAEERGWSDAFAGWSYALSDLILRSDARYDDFCIVERKSLRNLTTSHKDGKISLAPNLTHLAKAGSVFRSAPEKLEETVLREDKVAEIIGYNRIITF